MSDSMIPFPVFIPPSSSSGGGDDPNLLIAMWIVANVFFVGLFGVGAWLNWDQIQSYGWMTITYRSMVMFFAAFFFCIVNGLTLFMYLVYLISTWLEKIRK